MGIPHILVIPCPAQGHVIPLMELALSLIEHGIKVTFVNTEFNHKRVLEALPEIDNTQNMINMVSIPDGLEPHEDRNDVGNLAEAIFKFMPEKLETLIEKINESDHDIISCVIADDTIGWAIDVAEKMGIRRAAFRTFSAACLNQQFSIPKLINDGIINSDGTLIKKQMNQLSPSMPPINTANLLWWTLFPDLKTQRIMFELIIRNNKSMKLAERLICNSSYTLEPAVFSLFPEILPIGPLLASNRLGKSAGYFWQEDSSCLAWLNQQMPRSVIYIAFGSFTVFDEIQFQELALGLELTNKPFLWVVRPDINNSYPTGFKDRISDRGHLVGWAPQQQVLSHPSIACFISHCGWNSTMEGVSNGVPFLCWPYFADQFLNQSYICDEWKVGLGFNSYQNGIITKDEIKSKVDQVLSDQSFRERALDFQDKATKSVAKGGCSNKHFTDFVKWIKENLKE